MTAGLGVTEYAPPAGGPLMRASRHLSYRRAWLLVDELNKLLSEPVVITAAVMGGGTTVTPVGEKTIALYHSIEAHTRAAARSEFQAFRKLMRS
jgi:molybdate transport system regulatory protein